MRCLGGDVHNFEPKMTKEESAKQWQKDQDALLHYDEPVATPGKTEAERIEAIMVDIRANMSAIRGRPVDPVRSATAEIKEAIEKGKKQYGIAKESLERYEKEQGKPYVLREGEYVL